jgi:uncharacterized protein (TIGR03089 family)
MGGIMPARYGEAVPASTFPDALAEQLRADPGRPVVTFYDDATGERIELSVTTYANWVAKTAGLLQDELGLERGGMVLLDLPTHWHGPVWLGAAWAMGLTVTADPDRRTDADVVVCGPDRVPTYAEAAGRTPVVALSLRPLGAPFAETLPPGVVDYAAVVLGQPDAFAAYDPPDPADIAWQDADGASHTQADLLATEPVSGRLLTDVNPCTDGGLETLLGPLRGGGGTVWVRNPAADGWDHRAETERVTQMRRDQPARS